MSTIDFDSLLFKPGAEIPPYINSKYQKVLQAAGCIRYEKANGTQSIYNLFLQTLKRLENRVMDCVVGQCSDNRITTGFYMNVVDYLTGLIRSAKALPQILCTSRCASGCTTLHAQPRKGPLMTSKTRCDTELLRMYSKNENSENEVESMMKIKENIQAILEPVGLSANIKLIRTIGGHAIIYVPDNKKEEVDGTQITTKKTAADLDNELSMTPFLLTKAPVDSTMQIVDGYTETAAREKSKVSTLTIENKRPEAVGEAPKCEEIYTPDAHTIADLAKFCNVGESATIKAVMFELTGYNSNISISTCGQNKTLVFVAIRGDKNVNMEKLRATLGLPIPLENGDSALSSLAACSDFAADLTNNGFSFASEQLLEDRGLVPGFSGLCNLSKKFLSGSLIVMDESISMDDLYIVGGNKKDTHIRNFLPSRDISKKANIIRVDIAEPDIADEPVFEQQFEHVKGFLIAESIEIAKNIKFADPAAKNICMQYMTVRMMDLAAILMQTGAANTGAIYFPILGKGIQADKDASLARQLIEYCHKNGKETNAIIDSRPKASLKAKLDCFNASCCLSAIVFGKTNQEDNTREVEIYEFNKTEPNIIKVSEDNILHEIFCKISM